MQIVFLLAAIYVWTPIEVPGATVVQAFSLNDREQTMLLTINGTDFISGTFRRGEFTPLPAPPAGFQVSGIGINNAGVITGIATTATNPRERGFILNDSTYTFFSRDGWDNTEPRAIDNAGLITGFSFNDNTVVGGAGFLFDPAAGPTGTFTDVTPPGSDLTIVQGSNKFRRIAGNGRQPGIGRYAFIWQQGKIARGKSQLLPFLDRIKIDQDGSNARGINDSGIIVGFTGSAAGTNEGFVGSDARGYQLLVPPGGEVAGNSTVCEGINNFAQVVCLVNDAAGNTLGAFIGSPAEDEDDDHDH
jgi:hypothetical protein